MTVPKKTSKKPYACTSCQVAISASKNNHTAMDQYKLKKIMRLTQLWIQDNKYSNHATTMKHSEWMKIRPVHPINPWKFEVEVLLTDMLVNIGKWKLVDIGRCSADMCQSTHMLTEEDTASTQDLIDLADHSM